MIIERPGLWVNLVDFHGLSESSLPPRNASILHMYQATSFRFVMFSLKCWWQARKAVDLVCVCSYVQVHMQRTILVAVHLIFFIWDISLTGHWTNSRLAWLITQPMKFTWAHRPNTGVIIKHCHIFFFSKWDLGVQTQALFFARQTFCWLSPQLSAICHLCLKYYSLLLGASWVSTLVGQSLDRLVAWAADLGPLPLQ